MTLLTQALMIATGIATGWLVAPFGIEATLANLLIGGLVIMRMTFTVFTCPGGRPSPWCAVTGAGTTCSPGVP